MILLLWCSVHDVGNMVIATSASTQLVRSGFVISAIVCTVVSAVAVIVAMTADLVTGVLRRILQDHILNRLYVRTVDTSLI